MTDYPKNVPLKLPDDKNYFILSVDVDGWSSLLSFYNVKHDPLEAAKQVDVNKGIENLLQLFNLYNVKATFFISGVMAKANHHSAKQIFEEGHELGCHGLTHAKNEFTQDQHKQQYNIEKSTKIITDITGSRPHGFRAPCLTFNQTTMRTILEQGYLYDSSVTSSYIPGYYGVPGAPNRPHKISLNPRQGKNECSLIELPVSVNPLLPIPLSAAWMRNLGANWVKFGIKANFRLKSPVTFFIHPRDVSVLPKVSGVPFHLYRNTGKKCIDMLESIFNFITKNDGKILSCTEYLKLLNRVNGVQTIDQQPLLTQVQG